MADTNVVVSAVLAPAGVCGRLVTAAAGECLVVSPSLLEELTAVLSLPKFSFLAGGQVGRFVAATTRVAEVAPDLTGLAKLIAPVQTPAAFGARLQPATPGSE
ncbi:MAG: hypothetical protein ACYCUD_13680 [Candidatus Dormibacteria bacterium]